MYEKLIKFTQNIEPMLENITTEEATKTALILPFFGNILGYNVFNPSEFTAELSADVSVKKGEKVDYAILIDTKPTIIIEAKPHTMDLNSKQIGQLSRYFHTTEASIGILTNGIEYQFYSDTIKQNVMDDEPFFTFNILNFDKAMIKELSQFEKDNYDCENISVAAANLKIMNNLKDQFHSFFNEPSDEFIKLCLKGIYEGQIRQTIIDEYRIIVKTAFKRFINDQLDITLQKASSALNLEEELTPIPSKENKITTTEDELEFYNIIKGLLLENEIIDITKIVYKDTESYFSINYTHNVRKWFVRSKFLKNGTISLETRNNTYLLESLNDLVLYSDEIKQDCISQISK